MARTVGREAVRTGETRRTGSGAAAPFIGGRGKSLGRIILSGRLDIVAVSFDPSTVPRRAEDKGMGGIEKVTIRR